MKSFFLTLIALCTIGVVQAQRFTDNPAELFYKKWSIGKIDKMLQSKHLTSPCVEVWKQGIDCSEAALPYPLTPAWLLEAHDLSEVWVGDNYLGFSGANYQRITFAIERAEKVALDEYRLRGTVRMSGMQRPMEGTLRIVAVQQREGDDCEEASEEQIYDIFGAYTISIYSTYGDSHGTQKGVFYSSVYELDDMVELNDLGGYCDGWNNNQFRGWVVDEKNKASDKVNFGLGRIPDSGDLDVGVGEFFPDEKYYAYGWAEYTEELRAERDNYSDDYEELHGEGTLNDGTRWLKVFRLLPQKDGSQKMNVTVIFMRDGKLVRSFRPKVDDVFVPMQSTWNEVGNVSMEDVDFDGHADVVISLGAGNMRLDMHYACYLYEPTTGRYKYVPQYQALPNANPDATQRLVHTHESAANDATEFVSWQWDEHRLVPTTRTVLQWKEGKEIETCYDYDAATEEWILRQ